MSCPDWRTLVAAREADLRVDSLAWIEARRHLAGCSRCRHEALAAEPLLVFDRLPERTVSPGEIARMQTAVASLVRASRVGHSGGLGHAGREGEEPGTMPAGLRSISRFAAALGICSLLALSGAPRPHAPELTGLAVAGDFEPVQSALEELDRPGSRIYELPQADMAVVMIVDANLDV